MTLPVRKINIDENGYLKELSIDDVTKKYIDGLNDDSVKKFLVASSASKQTRESVEEYVKQNAYSEDSILFGLYVESELSGTIRLHDISEINGSAIIGICLFEPKIWGKGWGSRAIQKVAEYGFNSINLTLLQAGIYKDNIAAQKTFMKAGFEYDNAKEYEAEAGKVVFMVLSKEQSSA